MFNFRSLIFRILYTYISKVDKNAEVVFMNYGYHDSSTNIPLDIHDEPNRYSIQLYHRLASSINLSGKKIVEIGSGRGGGLSYISRTFKPASALGIDLDSGAINFCNNCYKNINLSFKQGDAQNLDLESEFFDVVLNVESSHRYPSIDLFLSEVTRILKPDGFFLYTDFRYNHEMPVLKELIGKLDMRIVAEQKINSNVIEALDLDDERRKKLVYKLMPRFLKGVGLNFAGAIGSKTYKQILSEEYIYFLYVLQKTSTIHEVVQCREVLLQYS